MNSRTNRRAFLQTSALAGAGYWVAGRALGQEKSNSPNEQINFACIGVGGKGQSDSEDASKFGNVVAICDIDDTNLEKRAAGEAFKKAKKFNDFRKMLDELGSSIDAVTVSTPDHTHATASVAAMSLGKHCFCQKPMSHAIYEARKLGELAREKKLVTQMGNQGTSENGVRQAAAMIKAGVLGNVKEVYVWTNRPIWPQGGPPPKAAECPKHVHWDLFLGPAKEQPYAKDIHPFAWRGFWDFGTGALGDMACHTMNMPFMALDLRNPVSVVAETSGHDKISYPRRSKIDFEFAATSDRGPLVLHWTDGGNRPPLDLFEGEKDISDSGCLLIGDKGKLYSPNDYGARFKLLAGAEAKEVEFTKSPGHFEEFAVGIKGGPAPVSNFADYSGPLTETVLLGNLAVWATGQKIEWDAEKMTANVPGLEEIVRPVYRAGWPTV